MIEKNKKIYSLAKLLSEIHSHSLQKFYSNKKSTFWDELEEKSTSKDEVDKEFFLRMAEHIIFELKKAE